MSVGVFGSVSFSAQQPALRSRLCEVVARVEGLLPVELDSEGLLQGRGRGRVSHSSGEGQMR